MHAGVVLQFEMSRGADLGDLYSAWKSGCLKQPMVSMVKLG